MNLNQVTIPVSELERSIAFYEKMGLKLIVKSAPHYARFVCPDGNTTFSLHHTEQLSVGEGTWIYFETENVDSKVQELIAEGLEFEVLPVDQAWLWREARLKDPDGNQIIIYYAGENRLDPPWKLT